MNFVVGFCAGGRGNELDERVAQQMVDATFLEMGIRALDVIKGEAVGAVGADRDDGVDARTIGGRQCAAVGAAIGGIGLGSQRISLRIERVSLLTIVGATAAAGGRQKHHNAEGKSKGSFFHSSKGVKGL